MARMKGFEHSCTLAKVIITENKKALMESQYSFAQIDMIWDFYVTHALGGESGLKRELSDYGWEKTDYGKRGIIVLEKELAASAGIEKFCFIRSKSCKDTLGAMDLSNDRICVNHPRAVLLQKYSITVDENENIQFAGGGENRINCLFRHICNSFAHGNTYCFENKTVLLEDKDGNTVSARILLKMQTLLDWIALIDKDKCYYVLTNACSKCKKMEDN